MSFLYFNLETVYLFMMKPEQIGDKTVKVKVKDEIIGTVMKRIIENEGKLANYVRKEFYSYTLDAFIPSF